jgi:hypothetical protein
MAMPPKPPGGRDERVDLPWREIFAAPAGGIWDFPWRYSVTNRVKILFTTVGSEGDLIGSANS